MAIPVIHDERANPEESLNLRRRIVADAVARSAAYKVLAPYYPRAPQPMAGEPAGTSGVLVAWNELDAELQMRIAAGAGADAPAKKFVRVATIGALDPYGFEAPNRLRAVAAGSLPSIDGVTLMFGDSILVKDEGVANQRYNGIWTVVKAGSPTTQWVLERRSDANDSGKVQPGLTMWVDEGITNRETRWTLATDAPIALNTTSLRFVQEGYAPTSKYLGSFAYAGTEPVAAEMNAAIPNVSEYAHFVNPASADVYEVYRRAVGSGVDSFSWLVLKSAVGPPLVIAPRLEQFTVLTDGQTDFVLALEPMDDSVQVELAGVLDGIFGSDFVVSGTSLTWVSAMALKAGEILAVRYLYFV